MIRAIIYCRVSTRAQQDEGTSLDSQAEACTAFAVERGLTAIRTLSEVYSGAYFHDRPLLNELRDAMRRGELDAIVFYAIDRLSRNVAHLAILSEECERYGVELLCVTEDFDRSAEGTLLRSVKAYTAEIEREKIRERTLRGRRTKAQSGKLVCGMSPYGYRDTPDGRVIVEDEAEIIRDIFDRFLAGQSTYAIQNALNDAGVPTPSRRGGVWHHTGITRILRNEIYCGRSYAFRTQKVTQSIKGIRRSSSTVRDRTEWIELPEGTTPAILSTQSFDAVQAKLDQNRRSLRRGKPESYLMRQRIVCGECGRKLRGEQVGTNWKAYRCVPYVPSQKCGNSVLKASVVESAVWERVSQIISQPQVVRDILSESDNQAQRKELAGELQRQMSAVQRLEGEIKRLVERGATVSDEVWRSIEPQIESRTKEMTRLRGLCAETQRSIDKLDRSELDLTNLDRYIATVAGTLDRMQDIERVQVIEALDVRAVWKGGKLTLSMTLSPLYSCNRLELVSDNSKRVAI